MAMSTATSKDNNLVAMEVDAMLEGECDGDEEEHKENTSEEQKFLFIIESDHKEKREIGDPDAQE